MKRISRYWRRTPTQIALEDLRLPISDARFERAMTMAARYMGGTYRNGVIRLPYRFRDPSFPTELTVLYRKMPCGFLNGESDGSPCVTFDVIPNIGGDPRRSKIYRSFPADMKSCKVQFGKFLFWLRVVGDAVRRYVAQAQEGDTPSFARIARALRPTYLQRYHTAREKVADLMPPLGHPGGTCKVVQRIVEEVRNPRLEDQLVSLVQKGRELSNPAAHKVYTPERERGAWKYKILLTPHAQYRMDLRGITVPEIRAALDNFFRVMNQERSKGDTDKWNRFISGMKMEWHDQRTNTFFVFVGESDTVRIITTYKPGEPDPRPTSYCPT